VRDLFFDWLAANRPELVQRYERLYARGAYAPVAERRRLGALLRTQTGPAGNPRGIADPRDPARRRAIPPGPESEQAPRPPPPAPPQTALF
jgi:hypothetical protein